MRSLEGSGSERTGLRGGGAVVAWAIGLLLIAVLDDPRRRFLGFVLAGGVSTVGWLVLAREAHRGTLPRRLLTLTLILAIAFRVGFWLQSPAFSDDVFRHVYEGRLIWIEGWGSVFRHPPAAAPDLGVPTQLLDEAWLRINHPAIPTIYPPLSQLVFAIAALLGDVFGGRHLLALKLLLVLADLGAWHMIHRTLRARGHSPALSLIYGACPLVIFEVAREGHADSLAVCALALGILGFEAARSKLGYAGFALAALAKLNGLVTLAAALRARAKGAWVAALILPWLAMPYVWAGSDAQHGLVSYATRWRSGDGSFSVLLWLSHTVIGGDWIRLGPITLTQHLIARGLTALCYLMVVWLVLRGPMSREHIAERAGWLLLALLLLSPTLHPWYAIWLLPFAVFDPLGRRPMLALVGLAWLLHHAAWLDLSVGWRDLAWVRALVHVPVWALALSAWRQRKKSAV